MTTAGERLSYSSYLKIDALLDQQECLAEPPAHDELQFIIVHQVYELWFKLVRHELEGAQAALQAGDDTNLRRALHLLRRVEDIFGVLVKQIHVLESMRPVDFLAFRGRLNPASGFGSVQFREVECMLGLKDAKLAALAAGDPRHGELLKRLEQPSLVDSFYALMNRRGFPVSPPADRSPEDEAATFAALRTLYIRPDDHPLEYALSEAFVELDELMILWRRHHVMMVERQIGDKPGTGKGVTGDLDGIRYLASTLGKRSVPDLWAVRSLLPD